MHVAAVLLQVKNSSTDEEFLLYMGRGEGAEKAYGSLSEGKIGWKMNEIF